VTKSRGAVEDVSYENTIKTLIHTKRAAYDDLSYLPVFRASGLFYALVDQRRTTHVVFLNYWREKNENASVGALVSLRNQAGEIRARFHFQVEEMTYQINARDIVDDALGAGAGSAFEGSLEVEFYTDKDLKYAFPALFVCYESPGGVSYVHTNQRTYNNLEDQRRSDPFNAGQTGFDISCRDGARPFVYAVNGPLPVKTAADIRIYNAAGAEAMHRIDLGDLRPYEANRLDLAALPGLSEFLGGEVGFVKLDLPLGGVFSRFTSGIESADGNWLGVTHSYFDNSDHADYYETNTFEPDQYPCFVPVNLVDGLETEIVLYPILAPSRLSMRLDCFDSDGASRRVIDLPGRMEGAGRRQVRVDLRAALHDARVEATEGLYVLHIEPEDGRLPTRITFGLNYRVGDTPGCNISSSVLMAPSYAARARAWLWGVVACRPGGGNKILISHFSKVKHDESVATVELTLYGRSGEICATRHELANGTALNADAEALLADVGYQSAPDEFIWYVARSDNPALIANQIHISANGHIGGDHSF